MILLWLTGACFQTDPSKTRAGQMLSSFENPVLIWNQCIGFPVLITYALLQNIIAEENTKENSFPDASKKHALWIFKYSSETSYISLQSNSKEWKFLPKL